MAVRYPLIVDTTDNNKIKELPSGDSLNLSGNNIVNVVDVTASGTLTVQNLVVESNTFTVDGNSLNSVAFTGSYTDLSNTPTLFDGVYASLTGKPTIPANIEDLANVGSTSPANGEILIYDSTLGRYEPGTIDASFDAQFQDQNIDNLNNVVFTGDKTNDVLKFVDGIWKNERVDFAEVTSKPTTLAGYGITDSVANPSTVDINIADGKGFGSSAANAGKLIPTAGSGYNGPSSSDLVLGSAHGIGVFLDPGNDDSGSAFTIWSNINPYVDTPGEDNYKLKLNGDTGNLGIAGRVTAIGGFRGDLTGSVFADDSTILVDGVSSSINLNGTVSGDIVPDTTEAYDLGSASNRFRDLYLSGTTINLGGVTISTDPVTGTVNLPINAQNSLGISADVGITGFYGLAPDTIGGLTIDTINSVPVTPNPDTYATIGPIFAYSKIVFATPISGFGAGIEYDYFNFPDITNNGKTPPTIVADIDGGGNLLSLEITDPGNATGGGESLGFGPSGDSFAYGAELNDNGDTGNIVTTQGGVIAGNVVGTVTGPVTGDLTGSVFADDSSLLVDAVNGEIPGYVKIADLKTALQDGAGDYAAFKAWVLANL